LSLTPRTALILGAIALGALILPPGVVGLLTVALLGATVGDALRAKRVPPMDQSTSDIMSRGVASPLRLSAEGPTPGSFRMRQPAPPDLAIDPAEDDGGLDARVVPARRGRHTLPAPAFRTEGPLGLGCYYGRFAVDREVLVYPDMPTAWRLALSVRRSRYRDAGDRRRGPLGLGTEFESIRDYLPDDDIRQVNWRATARLGRPMSNQYRIEQDRDVICLIDSGRLMTAPLEGRTRLDAAVDATAAVALVADEVGDRCGALAFDGRVQRNISPQRKGGNAVVRGIFDLEPTTQDSDYELAFRHVSGLKRSYVLVFTDLLEEAAARPLIEAVPVLARRHAVAVVSAADSDLQELVARRPETPVDVYRAAAALEVLNARERVAASLRATGAEVLEAPVDKLAAACVDAYLRAKVRARL